METRNENTITYKPRLFIDMDGTLARFHDEAHYLERMFEEGFFRDLKPFENAVEGVRKFITDNPDVEVFVLSAAVDGEPPYCRIEKDGWLDKYLPEIDGDHRIYTKVGVPKSEYIDGGIRKNDFLLDDYNKNLNEWLEFGGNSIKCVNNINNRGLGAYGGEKGKLWQGDLLSNQESSDLFAEKLGSLINGTPVKLQASETAARAAAQSQKTTVVINAFGGAGAGKSTACLHIVAELKKRGYVAEYASEYAKDLVWENNLEMLDGSLKNQSLILEEQSKRVDRLIGKVDFAVTDSPILLNGVYLKDCPEKAQYCADILEKFNGYNNFNFVVKRDTANYEQEGRVHSLAEATQVDKEVEDLLIRNNLYFGTYDHSHLDTVVDNAIKTLKRYLYYAERDMQNVSGEYREQVNTIYQYNDDILDLTDEHTISR